MPPFGRNVRPMIFRGVLAKTENRLKQERTSPLYSEMRRALMYLISRKLAQMRKANIAKISLLIFIIEPSIWRLRNGR